MAIVKNAGETGCLNVHVSESKNKFMKTNEFGFEEISNYESVEINGGYPMMPADRDTYREMGNMIGYAAGWVSGFVRGALGLN